jgi:hypothetical protein
MKALLTSVIFLGLSSALFANVAATPSPSQAGPTHQSVTQAPKALADSPHRLTAQIPYPDPNSPYPPMLTAQIPYPDPNSPYPPMFS